MSFIIEPVANLLLIAIKLYSFTVVAYIILSWLRAFGMLDSHNQFVSSITGFLNSVVDPVLNRIRRLLPETGGIDLSPIILFLILFFIQDLIVSVSRKLVLGI